jgi:hypothetical protein
MTPIGTSELVLLLVALGGMTAAATWAVIELKKPRWPAPGSEDTELGVLMELEVGHGETEVYARVQA